jgi:hypothetical protein
MVTIADFYKFGTKLDAKTFQARPVGFGRETDLDLLTGDFSRVSIPVIFGQEDGSELCDVLGTGFSGLYLISDRMRDVLASSGLSGWTSYEIRLTSRTGDEIKGYNGFSILGRCGPIDTSRSQIVKKRLVPEGPVSKYFRGLHVGLEHWDGSDFFLPQAYYGTIITEKAAKVLKAAKLTNIELRNLEDIEINSMTADLIKRKAEAFNGSTPS